MCFDGLQYKFHILTTSDVKYSKWNYEIVTLIWIMLKDSLLLIVIIKNSNNGCKTGIRSILRYPYFIKKIKNTVFIYTTKVTQ
jgi:hypothetical protein